MGGNRTRRRLAAGRTQAGQSTTEFVLLVSLIAIPLWVLLRELLRAVLHDFIINLINRFTQG